jgi:hypothetical protein
MFQKVDLRCQAPFRCQALHLPLHLGHCICALSLPGAAHILALRSTPSMLISNCQQ